MARKELYRQRSATAAYEVNGKGEDGEDAPVLRSAYQRKEILEQIVYDDNTASVHIVGHYKRTEDAVRECEEFNREQWEKYEQNRVI